MIDIKNELMMREYAKKKPVTEFVNALKTLLKDNPIETIRISTITEKAHYSRGLFYKYFESVDDLLLYSLCFEIYHFISEKKIEKFESCENWFLYFAEQISSHNIFMMSYLRTNYKNPTYMGYLERVLLILTEIIFDKAQIKFDTQMSRKIIINFYTTQIINIYTTLIECCGEANIEMIDELYSLIIEPIETSLTDKGVISI